MIKYLIVMVIFMKALSAENFAVPQIVLDAIKDTECLKKDGINYPFFIRINKKVDVLTAKKNKIKMSGRILQCHNAKGCSDKVKELLSIGIKNIDLGPYQINYFYQHSRWSHEEEYSAYFKHDSAEKKAREILRELIKTYGYSWRTLGRYHHYDPNNKKRNRVYFSKLYEYIYGEKPPIAKLLASL